MHNFTDSVFYCQSDVNSLAASLLYVKQQDKQKLSAIELEHNAVSNPVSIVEGSLVLNVLFFILNMATGDYCTLLFEVFTQI